MTALHRPRLWQPPQIRRKPSRPRSWAENFGLLAATPRYISHFDADTNYIATTKVPNMPQALPLPPIDAVVQQQTITMDFGAGPYLPDGVTLMGTPSVTLSVISGVDTNPGLRITASPTIGLAPAPYGSDRIDCAVLFQVGNLIGEVTYLIQCSCPRTDGDVASMDATFLARIPGTTPPL